MAQPMYLPAYTLPVSDPHNRYNVANIPQPAAAYSTYASPSSTFSPSQPPMTYNTYEQSYSYPQSPNLYPWNQEHFLGTSFSHEPIPQSNHAEPSMYSHFDWSNLSSQEFENFTTSPPTPDMFLPIQHPESALPTDDAIPYHSLSDSEPEGEVLQGLGLYDNPEMVKSTSDPQLNSYRSMMMTQFFGSGHRRSEPESTGKGLKLEETWTPPSDSEDEEDDDEKDGEGEDDDDPPGVQQLKSLAVQS
jgi:hypothetical protein